MIIRFKLFFIAFFALQVGVSYAASKTGSVQSRMAIQAHCTVSATALNFGTTGLITANRNNNSTIRVTCSRTTPYKIGINFGLNGTSTANRKMKRAGSADAVSYFLFRNSARTQAFGNTIGVDTIASTGNGANRNHIVYGRVTPQTAVSAGTYTDTLTVTITY